ncbi:hypothetical protein QYE76_064444 [Lolium multiflorum]|uniref:Uncharacterized protein n=1 Tax=Lolium multiflorum TaxID=4521 RepID=A0AAD8W9Z8_LOLMU|nr:hypothetical protein QYE76_064444 [Lolium multiflorum]
MSLPATFLVTRRHSGVVALVGAATGRTTTFAELWRAVAGAATALSAPPFSIAKSLCVITSNRCWAAAVEGVAARATARSRVRSSVGAA